MSFILDALRRAETQRGYQPPAPSAEATLEGIAAPVIARPSARTLAAAAIAAATLVAALLYMTRSADAPPAQQQQVASAAGPSAPLPGVGADTPLAEVAATPRRVVRPLRSEAGVPPPASTADVSRTTPGTVVVAQQPLQAAGPENTTIRTLTNITEPVSEQLPGYRELVLSGRAQLPEFHLDIHVYAADRASRFVFVNNRKYKEGDSLDEGGTVERITAAGVVLNHRGHRFELLPD